MQALILYRIPMIFEGSMVFGERILVSKTFLFLTLEGIEHFKFSERGRLLQDRSINGFEEVEAIKIFSYYYTDNLDAPLFEFADESAVRLPDIIINRRTFIKRPVYTIREYEKIAKTEIERVNQEARNYKVPIWE